METRLVRGWGGRRTQNGGGIWRLKRLLSILFIDRGYILLFALLFIFTLLCHPLLVIYKQLLHLIYHLIKGLVERFFKLRVDFFFCHLFHVSYTKNIKIIRHYFTFSFIELTPGYHSHSQSKSHRSQLWYHVIGIFITIELALDCLVKRSLMNKCAHKWRNT